jgi:hypothetical protein
MTAACSRRLPRPLLPAIPVRPDRGRRPARPESAAVPTPPVKTGSAIPKGGTTGAGPLPFDDFGRLIARQETVTVPRTVRRPLFMGAPGRCGGRRQKEPRNRYDNRSNEKAAVSGHGGSAAPCAGGSGIIACNGVVVAHCALLWRGYPCVLPFATPIHRRILGSRQCTNVDATARLSTDRLPYASLCKNAVGPALPFRLRDVGIRQAGSSLRWAHSASTL